MELFLALQPLYGECYKSPFDFSVLQYVLSASDWLIDYIVFNAISAIFRPYNDALHNTYCFMTSSA